jgi:hypothetical protein
MCRRRTRRERSSSIELSLGEPVQHGSTLVKHLRARSPHMRGCQGVSRYGAHCPPRKRRVREEVARRRMTRGLLSAPVRRCCTAQAYPEAPAAFVRHARFPLPAHCSRATLMPRKREGSSRACAAVPGHGSFCPPCHEAKGAQGPLTPCSSPQTSHSPLT